MSLFLVTAHFPRKIRDTPCARCSHAHAGSDYIDGWPRCGEWMSAWSWERAVFYVCECPEWVQPPHRCVCGKTSLTPFPAWLDGSRRCAPTCESIRLSEAEK